MYVNKSMCLNLSYAWWYNNLKVIQIGTLVSSTLLSLLEGFKFQEIYSLLYSQCNSVLVFVELFGNKIELYMCTLFLTFPFCMEFLCVKTTFGSSLAQTQS